MDLRIDCWSRLHQLILRYTPTTGLTGLLDDDDDEDEKRWLNKTAGSPIFGFSFRQGLEPRYGYQWSPLVKIRSSKKSGKHRSSFPRYSKAAKVVTAILFGGESYLVTLPRY
uniref:Uncharacterized protein n=1 Tax=Amphimedon queenslandica TaxID=400682 RepID=A0A1X7TPH2_AMPQE